VGYDLSSAEANLATLGLAHLGGMELAMLGRYLGEVDLQAREHGLRASWICCWYKHTPTMWKRIWLYRILV
jgi:hypothetical protein